MKKSKLPIRKRSALLLELLISFTLVVVCLFPLLKPLATIKKHSETKHLFSQLERAARVLAADVKTTLYEQHYSWNQLQSGKIKGAFKEKIQIETLNGKKREVQGEFKISKLRSYTKNSHRYIFMTLEISFEKHSFPFYFFLEELPA